MSELDNNEVVARLEKIERENRNLKRCVALVSVALGTLVIMAQAPRQPRTIEAERLVIRYPNGKEAITLGTQPAVIPSKGLSAQADFINPAGRVVAHITADPVSGGTVHVNSPTAGFQMNMNASSTFPGNDFSKEPDGESAKLVIMQFPKGQAGPNVMFNLSADTSGEISQSLQSRSYEQLRLINGPDGASVQLLDNPKTVRAVLGKVDLETIRTGSQETRPLSSLVLLDKEGKVLWRAP